MNESGHPTTICNCRQPGLGGDCDGSCQHPPPQTTERDTYWVALTEIAFANLEGGPTPTYIREHAKRALQMEGVFPECQEQPDG